MCRYLPNVANVCFKIQLNMLLISMNAAKDVELQKSVPIRPKTDKFAKIYEMFGCREVENESLRES